MISINHDTVTALIAEVADEFILPRFRNLRSNDIGYKIGDDPVTIADKEAEKALSTRLLDLLPGSKVVGEEDFSANQGILSHFFGESPVWIVDPIDGTRNFVAGSPEFGVIVALTERNQAVAGWIYDPASRDVITAEKGSGAYHQGKRLKTLPAANLSDMYGFLGDYIVQAHKKNSPLGRITGPKFDVMTPCSHEYPRLVVAGPHFGKDKPQAHFRATLTYSTPWDDAAGVLIHQESGGYSAYWDESPYQPSIMHRGFALTPDRDSWHEFREWGRTFTQLPVEE